MLYEYCTIIHARTINIMVSICTIAQLDHEPGEGFGGFVAKLLFKDKCKIYSVYMYMLRCT